jgi:RIO kinase 3
LCTVHVSFEKYRSLHSYLEEEEQASDEGNDDDRYEEGDDHPVEQAPRSHRRSKGVAVGAVTKHDAVLCGRKNVRNMEKFPPDFPAGDLDGQDYRLSNSVYNTLKHHSQKEEKYVSVTVLN